MVLDLYCREFRNAENLFLAIQTKRTGWKLDRLFGSIMMRLSIFSLLYFAVRFYFTIKCRKE